jgi:AAA domain
MNAFVNGDGGVAESGTGRKDWVPPPSEEYQQQHPGWDKQAGAPDPELRKFLSADAWLKRDFPDPEPLLGELIVAGVRMFIVGRTGLGKTLFGFALAVAMATGQPFLHWRGGRPVRVLYIDGEMPGALIKQRLCDALLRRPGGPDLAGRLTIFARDMEDEFAEHFPNLGRFQPLNTEAGHNWLLALIDAIGGVDVVVLDNVMSLLEGIQKEEEAWTGASPLVDKLSRGRITQIWLDHTGHNSDRQYGTSTKSWRFDTLGIMKPLPPEQLRKGEVGFHLSFDPPDGKCRRRTPANWSDFESCIVRLKDDRWTSEPADSKAGGEGKVRPGRVPFYDALVSATTKSTAGPGRTTLETWQLECLRRGLIEKPPSDGQKETSTDRGKRYAQFRVAKSEFIAAKWIAIDGDRVTDLRGRWG